MTSKRRPRLIFGLAVAVLALAAAPTMVAQVRDQFLWRYVAAVRTDSAGVDVQIELWNRGSEAVLVEATADGLRYVQCRDGDLVEYDSALTHVVRRQNLAPEQCFRWATGSLLGADWLRGMTRAKQEVIAGEVTDTYIARDGTAPFASVAVRPVDGLPLRATTRAGEEYVWRYTEVGRTAVDPPALPSATTPTRETYLTMSRTEAAAVIPGIRIPAQVGEFEFDTAFSYTSDRTPAATLYVIWLAADGREAQLVVTQGRRDVAELGLSDLGGGWILRLQEGARYVQLLAPDEASLELVRSQLGLRRP